MKWLVLDGLEQHWERATVTAEIADDHTVTARTTNVAAMTFDFGAGGCPLDPAVKPDVVLDDQRLVVSGPMSDRSWLVHFRKTGGRWVVATGEDSGLRKRHGLQGPIDDAFVDSFLVVRPTGTAMSSGTANWAVSEQAHALRE
jgi:hypothetical protein